MNSLLDTRSVVLSGLYGFPEVPLRTLAGPGGRFQSMYVVRIHWYSAYTLCKVHLSVHNVWVPSITLTRRHIHFDTVPGRTHFILVSTLFLTRRRLNEHRLDLIYGRAGSNFTLCKSVIPSWKKQRTGIVILCQQTWTIRMLTPLSHISHGYPKINSPVTDPDADHSASRELSDRVPSWFDAHGNNASSREDVRLWIILAALPSAKPGPVVVEQLLSEGKLQPRQLKPLKLVEKAVLIIFCDGRTQRMQLLRLISCIMISLSSPSTHGEKNSASSISYLDFIYGVNMILKSNLDNKLKGHLLWRKANLD